MRNEFTKAVKLAAWKRANGCCETCTAKLFPGNIEFHHATECTFDGGAELDNCTVLCRACHSAITRRQAAVIAKSNRVRSKHLGIHRTSRSFSTNRNAPFKKKITGEVVRR